MSKVINSKSKKSELVGAVVSLGLLTEVEAKAKNAKELYDMIKSFQANESINKEEQSSPKAKKLPRKKVTKKDEKSSEESESKVESKVESKSEQQVLEEINVSSNEAVETKTNDETVEQITEDKTELQENEDTEVDIQVVAEDKVEKVLEPEQVHDSKESDMKNDIIGHLEHLSNILKQTKESENKYKTNFERLQRENNALSLEHQSCYLGLVTIANTIAVTKNKELLPYYNLLVDVINSFKRCDKVVSLLNMQQIIIEDAIIEEEKAKLEAEEKARLEAEEAEVHSYTGAHISYKDGELIKNKSTKKSQFKEYKAWFDETLEWVEYIKQESEDISKIGAIPKRKKAFATLKDEIQDWLNDWADQEIEEETIELAQSIIDELIKDKDEIKAICSFCKIFDEWEF